MEEKQVPGTQGFALFMAQPSPPVRAGCWSVSKSPVLICCAAHGSPGKPGTDGLQLMQLCISAGLPTPDDIRPGRFCCLSSWLMLSPRNLSAKSQTIGPWAGRMAGFGLCWRRGAGGIRWGYRLNPKVLEGVLGLRFGCTQEMPKDLEMRARRDALSET